MCGIAGISTKRGSSQLGPAIRGMCDSMQRRGPDDEGYVSFRQDQKFAYSGESSMPGLQGDMPYLNISPLDENLDVTNDLILGFRRLSILDISEKGHQPMSDKQGRYWIVFNGEIYNYQSLRDELTSLGYRFYSNTDTEVVLKSYKQWGEKCLKRFNGMFALAIYDCTANEIFLARDRIGIKPLYYHDNPEHFIFGSTINSIIQSGLYTAEIDTEGLQQNFVFAISQRPKTAFKDIQALAPAHYLKIDLNSGQKVLKRYWDIPVGMQDTSMSEKAAIDELEELLMKSIKYRLHADVEVGTFMSGGIDSTLISAMAGRMQKGIKAFTLGVNGKYSEINEIDEAAANAKLNGLEHIVGRINAEDICQHLDDVVGGYEEPYHHLPVNFLISNLVQQSGLKVVLNGLGGDELFAGYDAYAKLPRWERIQMFPKVGKLLPTGVHQKADKLKKFSKMSTIGEYYAHYYSTFEQAEINALFESPTPDIMKTIEQVYNPDNLEFSDDMEALSYYNIKSYIGSHHVRTIDQFTMHHSIEGRFPMLDHELVEFAFRVPSRLKIHNLKQKYILRKLAKRYIAPECLQMKKKGFSLPLKEFMNDGLKDLVQDSLGQLQKRDLFKKEGLKDVIKGDNPAQLWHLVMTELWCQKFIDSK
jgi:asparagine synthase (glutamine-hydrolysing)